jgi:hypothetical protein
MKRLTAIASGWILLGAIALLGCSDASKPSVPVGPPPEPTPLAKTMQRMHRGPGAILPSIRFGLMAEESATWEETQQATKEYADLCASLQKETPPKGDKESWAKLTKKCVEDAMAMDAAARKKDMDATLAAHQKVSNSCGECHKAHKK